MNILIVKSTKIFFFVSFFIINVFANARSAEIFKRDQNHRGLVYKNDFSYFPENRMGNGLYRDNNLLISKPNITIFDALLIKNTNSVIFLYENELSKLELGLYNNEKDGNGRFKKINDEFYEYTNNAIGYQRIFRLINKKIIPVLEKLRTGTGVTLSKDHAVFYHIAQSGNTIIKDENGSETTFWNYKFRLHLTKKGNEKIMTIYNFLLEDSMPSLGLVWKNTNVLEVTKSNGKIVLINLKDVLPEMFK